MLPGGTGRGRRDYRLRPATGMLELSVAEAADSPGTVPERVTAVLARALAGLGGETPTADRVDALCVGDRQYLMVELAGLLGVGSRWHTGRCGACGAAYDVLIDLTALPVQEAGPGYPTATVDTRLGTLTVRVPTGADQAAVAGPLPWDAALVRLAVRCVLEVAGRGRPDAAALEGELTVDDLAPIDMALDRLAPQVPADMAVTCPQCRAAQRVPIDPYTVLSRCAPDRLLREVHRLARAYSWSEAEILSLPSTRRRRYLTLIDQEHEP